MTVAQLMDSLNMSLILKSMVKGYAVARYPGLLGKQLSVKMDGETGVVTVCLDNEPCFAKSFEELEAFVNGPKKDDVPGPAGESTPEYPENSYFPGLP